MRPYLLFYGGDAEFGWDAFAGSFDTLEEVVRMLIVKSNDKTIPWQKEDINWQVIDAETSEKLADRTDGFPGRPSFIEHPDLTAAIRKVLLSDATHG